VRVPDHDSIVFCHCCVFDISSHSSSDLTQSGEHEALILCLPLMLVQPSLFTNTTGSKALVYLKVTKEDSL